MRLLSLIFIAPWAAMSFAVAAPKAWQPLLAEYCFDCHDGDSAKGEIDLEAALAVPLAEQLPLWEKVTRQMRARQMPPLSEQRPSDAESDLFSDGLEAALDAHAAAHPNPGRTASLRRLTRSEYQYAIRDLLGIEIDAATLLPPEQSSHGFDNITVGDLPPALLERYISAAQKISRQALRRTDRSPGSRTLRISPDITQEHHVEGLPLGTRGGTLFRHDFPLTGDYEMRVHLMRDRNEEVEGLRGSHELQILVDGEMATSFQVNPPQNRKDHTKVDAHLMARINVDAGRRDLGVTFVAPAPALNTNLRKPYASAFNMHRHPRRSPAVYQITVAGPFDTEPLAPLPADVDQARDYLSPLLTRAYRGQEKQADQEKCLQEYQRIADQDGHVAGLEAALATILVSPKFLFRIERDPDQVVAGQPYAVDDLALASRLSFLLWSSLPDDELLQAAHAGELSDAKTLTAQLQRMLADPRAESLANNFASQWLFLRNLEGMVPDGRLYPDFDGNLRTAMRRETELLFLDMIREDRSVLDLLRSDHTFLNERLASHYEMPHVYGSRFRRVAVDPQSGRGGLLRHASILTLTSYATRTSPVLRGNWVLENLLGTPLPPPPADVPSLEDARIDADLPVRERLTQHREDRSCAHCHDVIDPVGFAFEHFDAIGRWRIREGEHAIDARGNLPGGTPFTGLAGLEQALLERPEIFVRTLTEKLLTFALGRGMQTSDAPAIRAIVRHAAAEDFRFSALLEGVVTSLPFRQRLASVESTSDP